jgi:hypothetical protein
MDIKSDPVLIKNPFTCKSSVGLRLSLDKDPRDKLDKEKYCVQFYQGKSGNIHMYNEQNQFINYTFGKNQEDTEMTTRDKYDYLVPAEALNKTAKVKHNEGLPLSFLNIKTEEEGIDWYKNNYPKIPDELLPIIARYHWGEPITKKAIKNERKKITRKLQQKGLVVEHKKVSLSFE